MATKTTGSGRGPGLETWDPNIKAPGITQRSGAYFSGEVAEIADYAAVNDNIQASILQAAKDTGAAMKAWKDDPNNPGEANSLLTPGGQSDGGGDSAAETDRAIRKISSVATENTTNQLETIIPDIADEFSDDKRYARKTRKGKPITYKNLRKDHKILANQRANEISEYNGLIKNHIETGWQNADESKIDWGNWGNHTNAQAFMKHLIHGNAEYKYKFDDKSKGTVITWGPNNENSITKTELQVAKDMWGDNTDGVASFETTFKANGELIAKDFTATQNLIKNNQLNPEEAEVKMNEAITRSIKNNYTYDDKKYLWDNVMANTNMFKNARNQKYNPETLFTYTDNEGVEQVNQTMEFIIDNYLEGKLREFAGFPPRAQEKPEKPSPPPPTGEGLPKGLTLENHGAYADIFNRVQNLAGVTWKRVGVGESMLDYSEEEIQEMTDAGTLPKGVKAGDPKPNALEGLIPEKADKSDKFYKDLYNAWNSESNGNISTFVDNITPKQIGKIVEHGLRNNGVFDSESYGGNWDHAQNVWDVWKEKHGEKEIINTVDEGEIGLTQSNLDELLNFSGDITAGQGIITTGSKKPKVIKRNGRNVVQMWYPKGAKYENANGDRVTATEDTKTTFDIGNKTGMQNMFRAIVGKTDTNTVDMNSIYDYLAELAAEQNK